MAGEEALALGFSPAAALRGRGAGAGAGADAARGGGSGRVLVGANLGAAGGRSGSGGEPPWRAAAAVNKVGGLGKEKEGWFRLPVWFSVPLRAGRAARVQSPSPR